MVNADFIAQNTPQPDGREILNYGNGSNSDIIKTIHLNLSRAIQQTRDIAPAFNGISVYDTVNNIQQYLFNNIRYKNDSIFKQKIKLPSDLVHNKIGDCKSFALFGAAVLTNLGIKNHLRYGSYTADPTPSHVYNVAFDGNKEIILDAVWQRAGGRFNSEKKATFKKDYNMRISSISGVSPSGGSRINKPIQNYNTMIGGTGTGIGRSKLRKAYDDAKDSVKAKADQLDNYLKEQAAIRERDLKNARDKAAEIAKKAGKLIVKFVAKNVFYSQRGAFMALLRQNFRGWANILNTKTDDTIKLWLKVGGEERYIRDSIIAGLGRKPKLVGAKQKLRLKKISDSEYELVEQEGQEWPVFDPENLDKDGKPIKTATSSDAKTTPTAAKEKPNGYTVTNVSTTGSGVVNIKPVNAGVNPPAVSVGAMVGGGVKGIGDAEAVAGICAAAATIIGIFAKLLSKDDTEQTDSYGNIIPPEGSVPPEDETENEKKAREAAAKLKKLNDQLAAAKKIADEAKRAWDLLHPDGNDSDDETGGGGGGGGGGNGGGGNSDDSPFTPTNIFQWVKDNPVKTGGIALALFYGAKKMKLIK